MAPAALGILLLAAACGGGGGEKEQEGETATATETAEGESPGAKETPAPDGNAGDVTEELKNLSEDWGSITAKVTYNFSSTSDGEKTETQMTLYSRPPDSRIDFSDDSGEIVFINADGTSYFCTSQDGEGSCFATPSGEEDTAPLPFFGEFADPDAIDEAVGDVLGVDIDRFDDKIAGQDAQCFSASGSFDEETGKATWCFADDGLLLLSAFEGGTSGEFRMEAVEVNRKVSGSDFEPPYPVTTIPTP